MERDIFYVLFQGELTACDTVLDAVAVKNANALLSDGDSPTFTEREIERLAKVLDKYAHAEAASRLRSKTARLRAVELVTRCGS
jgi:hypothetical protein